MEVVEWEERTPICFLTPDYVTNQKNVSQEKARLIRLLSTKVNGVGEYYAAGKYAEAAALLNSCAEDQTNMKLIGLTPVHYSGGGGW